MFKSRIQMERPKKNYMMDSKNNSQGTLQVLGKLMSIVNKRRRFEMIYLIIVMVASGLTELITLGAVIPFLAVITNPEVIWENSIMRKFAYMVSAERPIDIVMPITFIFVLAAIISAAMRLVNIWLSSRLVARIGADINKEIYKKALYKPYAQHLRTNSAELVAATFVNSSKATGAVSSAFQLLSGLLIVISLIAGLMLINLKVALITFVLFGSFYLGIARLIRKYLIKASGMLAEGSKLSFQRLNEGLGAIREIILTNKQAVYVDEYAEQDQNLRLIQARVTIANAIPKNIVETIGIILLALIGLGLYSSQDNETAVLPVLGAIALGAQRLLPAFQQVFGGWSGIKSAHRDIEIIYLSLSTLVLESNITVGPLPVRKKILIKDASFSYGNGMPEVISNFNLEIGIGERLGIIGKTGSGKSTAVDILMGLVKADSGHLLIDDTDVYSDLSNKLLVSWRQNINHVPQNIYLSDRSIMNNIAFGEKDHEINIEEVELAAKRAHLSEFIESLPDKYMTFVGDRGIRLSGGQRQRIGIARALYRSGKILILDEATSALDIDTENKVMESINELDDHLTVIVIAHRLDTIRRCTRVVRIEKGQIVDSGSPSEVINRFKGLRN